MLPHRLSLALACTATLVLGACASNSTNAGKTSSPAPVAQPPATNTQVVKSRDGRYTGEIIGKLSAGSKFAKLQIGMEPNEVQDILDRAPDRFHTYESGKRWIPFYFGNDARRMQVLYKGEGCLIFTGGNIWGGGGGDLIQIQPDLSGECYQP